MIQPPVIFRERLYAARMRLGLSQADVAARARIDPSVISNFERGRRRPGVDNLARLAMALFVSTDYLLGLTDVPMSQHETDQINRIMDTLSDDARGLVIKFATLLAPY